MFVKCADHGLHLNLCRARLLKDGDEKAEGMGADLVREALGFQLLLFEGLLQSENLSLVFLHRQLHHLAGLGDPLIGPGPAAKAQAHFRSPTSTTHQHHRLEKGRWPASNPDKQLNRLQAG